MPPTPRLIIELNEHRYIDACEELGLVEGRPVVRFAHAKHQHFYGTYTAATRTVTCFADLNGHTRNRLPFVHTQVALTILHELRHAWQYEADNMPEVRLPTSKVQGHSHYEKVEADAEGWAQNNLAKFRGIVRVKRKFHRGGLSRLAATERKARP